MVKMEWKGLKAFTKKLQERPAELKRALAPAMFEEANTIVTEAKILTPVDTGALKNSGHVQLPEVTQDDISVKMGFGGPAASYAPYVHEDLTKNHPVGQAKFLEEPFLKAKKGMAQRLATKARARLD